MVTRIGEEYEFLTGERRTFEDEVATVGAELRQQDREAGLARHFVYDPDKKTNHLLSLLGFETVPFKGAEFPVRVSMDGTSATREGTSRCVFPRRSPRSAVTRSPTWRTRVGVPRKKTPSSSSLIASPASTSS